MKFCVCAQVENTTKLHFATRFVGHDSIGAPIDGVNSTRVNDWIVEVYFCKIISLFDLKLNQQWQVKNNNNSTPTASTAAPYPHRTQIRDRIGTES